MRIAVIPGDGIGKDVTAEAVKVLGAVVAASGKRLDLQHLPWGADHFLATGETLPADGYRMLRDEFATFCSGPGSSSISMSTTGRFDCWTIVSRP